MTKQFIPMRKFSLRRVLGLALAFFMAASLAVSCYDDSELRASINDIKSQLSQLQTLVNSLQNDDAVLGVTNNPDGSYTIKFKKSGDVTIKNGKDGAPGKDGEPGKDGCITAVVKGDESYTFLFGDGSSILLPRYCETRTLTFEDADYRGPENTVAYWSSKIDDPQYGGPILYGDGCTWSDENNTFLTSKVLPYDATTWSGGFSGGGIAISNYGNGMLNGADYTRQLEVFNPELDGAGRKGCGHNGSDNFAIVYDAGAYASLAAMLLMSDKTPRVIESVFVTNTCYTLNTLINGNDYAAAMANTGFFKVTAVGFDGGSEAASATADFYLAKNISFVTGWTEWDLSKLGPVAEVVFTISGSPEQYGDWGINTPTYFALDDVSVRVYPD